MPVLSRLAHQLPAWLCLWLVALPLLADESAQKARELGEVRERIRVLEQELQAKQQRKSDVEQELQQVERRIGSIRIALQKIGVDLETHNRELKELQAERLLQDQSLKSQRHRLAEEVRAAYVMGHQQQVKLILNQEDPASVSRMLVYFGYFSRARMQRINSVRSTLEKLHSLEASIHRQTATLNELQQRQQQETQQLLEQKDRRRQMVVRLEQELKDQGQELGRLQSSEKELQKLLLALQQLLADIPDDVGKRRPFQAMKGRLHWPAAGHLARYFGSLRGNTGLKWTGVLIEGPEGAEVRAVSQGRVAFADWMRGFGLLLIIDHGDGYMSLYGHNQALYKEVGEWVDSGEVVSALGASGGQTRPGLYFELRYKGQPVNPQRWCAGKPVPASG